MIPFLGIISFILLASILTGLVRVLRASRPVERMLAAQLFGTTAVAIILILSRMMEMPALLDVAMVFALLAAVTLVAYVVLAGRKVS